MTRCQVCGRLTEPREKPVRVVVERRKVQFYEGGRRVGEGFQTARELTVHQSCAAKAV